MIIDRRNLSTADCYAIRLVWVSFFCQFGLDFRPGGRCGRCAVLPTVRYGTVLRDVYAAVIRTSKNLYLIDALVLMCGSNQDVQYYNII